MKNLFLVLICMISWGYVGCTITGIKNHDPYFDKYIEEFKKESKGKITDSDLIGLTTRFKVLKHPTIGKCYYYLKHIDIDPKFWYNISELEKKSLIYHELAHAICWRDHDDNDMKNRCPRSIMNSEMITKRCLNRYWDIYIKELYNECNIYLKKQEK